MKSDYQALKHKLESYSNSKFVLDHILDQRKPSGDKHGLGYTQVPPPMNDNYTFLPEEDELLSFEPTTPLCADPVVDNSESSNVKPVKFVSSSEPATTKKGVVEDCETDSDDENDETERVVTKDEDIPESNCILMEKPKKNNSPVASSSRSQPN